MLTLGRPSDARLARILAEAQAAAPSYEPEHVGATVSGALPPGYRHGRYDTVVGHGDAAFARAAHSVRTWAGHRRLGMRIVADTDTPTVGGTVLVVVPVGPLHAVARCRVVAVVEEPDRVGFAYGSLPGHPERGEEAFLVECRPDGAVVFSITVFFRHARPLVRLGGPVASAVQRRFTRGYLAAQRAIAREEPDDAHDRRRR